MERGYEFLPVKCANCQAELIRLKQSETDMVVCPVCYAAGDYERVIKESAGLTKTIHIEKETRDLIEDLTRKRRQQGP